MAHWIATAALVAALACLAAGAPALAAPAPAGAAAVPAPVEDARQRFRRGVELHDEGDLAGAQAEFARAYELVPSYKILYNLGQIAYEQRDYAMALERFSRYLRDGGAEIAEARRRAVEEEIERLRLRIGRLAVTVPAAGAQLYVDDLPIATATPPAPVAVNIGRRKVEVVLPGGERQVRFVDVPGGDTIAVRFEGTPKLAATSSAGPPPPAAVAVTVPSARPVAPAPARRAHATPWAGWIATGLLGAGAGVSGGLALSASRDLEQQRSGYPARYDDLQSAQSDARRWALISDGLLIGTVVVAAVTAYLTLAR